jgi:hypothetical protein
MRSCLLQPTCAAGALPEPPERLSMGFMKGCPGAKHQQGISQFFEKQVPDLNRR